MRAISLWQPWATAVARGSKRIETRHWSTAYRGPLAIHAAKRFVRSELRAYHGDPAWRAAMGWTDRNCFAQAEEMPFGALIAVTSIVDCLPVERIDRALLDTPRHPMPSDGVAGEWTERLMGDFSPGRFGWILGDVAELLHPIPFRGAQSFFNVPDELLPQAARGRA